MRGREFLIRIGVDKRLFEAAGWELNVSLHIPHASE